MIISPVPGIGEDARLVFDEEEGRIKNVRLEAVNKLFIEEVLRGRALELLPSITPIFCSSDSWSYTVASVMAVEDVLGRKPTIPALGLRRLGLLLEIIENHVRNNAFKTLPLLGVDVRGEALGIIKYTSRVKELLTGRILNPVIYVPGGASWKPDNSILREMAGLARILSEKIDDHGRRLIGNLRNNELYNKMLNLEFSKAGYVAVIGGNGEPGIIDGEIALLKPSGGIEKLGVNELLDKVNISSMGFSYWVEINGVGPVRSGPLARLNIVHGYPSEKASSIYEEVLLITGGKPVHNPFYTVLARIVESIYAAELVYESLSDTDWLSGVLMNTKESPGKIGYGVVDGGRGLIIHRYLADEKLVVRDLSLYTPSHFNYAVLRRDLSLLKGRVLGDETVRIAEALSTLYDPCVSELTINPVVKGEG